MENINAAVVEILGEAPQYRSVQHPPADPSGEVVEVLAVGLHPVTRSIASGAHYARTAEVPFIPGIDAVVRRADGSLAYVGGPGSATLAEKIVIDPRQAIPLPADADPAVVAATMNPAMSSWIALRARVPFERGQDVLVLGATGNAGSAAVKVAGLLGARRVIAAGRNRERLARSLEDGADRIVVLGADADADARAIADAAADVDIVLDYLWGATAEAAMSAIARSRLDPTRVLDWVHIGGMVGSSITLDGAVLRSHALRISGSGFGSFDMGRADLPGLAAAIGSGAIAVVPRIAPLSDIAEAWAYPDAPGERTVIVP